MKILRIIIVIAVVVAILVVGSRYAPGCRRRAVDDRRGRAGLVRVRRPERDIRVAGNAGTGHAGADTHRRQGRPSRP